MLVYPSAGASEIGLFRVSKMGRNKAMRNFMLYLLHGVCFSISSEKYQRIAALDTGSDMTRDPDLTAMRRSEHSVSFSMAV